MENRFMTRKINPDFLSVSGVLMKGKNLEIILKRISKEACILYDDLLFQIDLDLESGKINKTKTYFPAEIKKIKNDLIKIYHFSVEYIDSIFK